MMLLPWPLGYLGLQVCDSTLGSSWLKVEQLAYVWPLLRPFTHAASLNPKINPRKWTSRITHGLGLPDKGVLNPHMAFIDSFSARLETSFLWVHGSHFRDEENTVQRAEQGVHKKFQPWTQHSSCMFGVVLQLKEPELGYNFLYDSLKW